MIDKPEPRRFPPPWIAEEMDTCFIDRDANGQDLRGGRVSDRARCHENRL
jgi:hypothetical protein